MRLCLISSTAYGVDSSPYGCVPDAIYKGQDWLLEDTRATVIAHRLAPSREKYQRVVVVEAADWVCPLPGDPNGLLQRMDRGGGISQVHNEESLRRIATRIKVDVREVSEKDIADFEEWQTGRLRWMMDVRAARLGMSVAVAKQLPHIDPKRPGPRCPCGCEDIILLNSAELLRYLLSK